MDSPKSSLHNQSGLTLVELVVVLAIFGLLAGLGFGVGADFYQQYRFHSDVSVLATTLAQARHRSMVQWQGLEHGVHFEAGKYVTFQGPTPVIFNPEDPSNHEVLVPSLVLPSDTSFEIIFAPLTGQARNSAGQPCQLEDSACALILTDFDRTEVINVTGEGAIIW